MATQKVTIKYGGTIISEFTDSKTVTLPTNGKLMVGGDITVTLDNGRLPSGYTELEYIQSSGTQYIDTGVAHTEKVRFYLDVTILDPITTVTSEIKSVFGCLEINKRIGVNTYHYSYTMYQFLYTTGSRDNNFPVRYKQNVRGTCSFLENTFTDVDGSTTYVATPTSFTGSNIYIFAVNNQGTPSNYGSSRMYNLKLYNSSTLVRDFVPCRKDSNSTYGMFDLVSQTFFGNSGTGTFIPGPEV